MIDLLLGTIVAASITFLIDRYNTKKANEQREHYNERACYDDGKDYRYDKIAVCGKCDKARY